MKTVMNDGPDRSDRLATAAAYPCRPERGPVARRRWNGNEPRAGYRGSQRPGSGSGAGSGGHHVAVIIGGQRPYLVLQTCFGLPFPPLGGRGRSPESLFSSRHSTSPRSVHREVRPRASAVGRSDRDVRSRVLTSLPVPLEIASDDPLDFVGWQLELVEQDDRRPA
jgi:hypothetical protein